MWMARTRKDLRFILLKANRLACHSFMYAGRRRGMLGSETKNNLLFTTTAIAKASSLLHQVHQISVPIWQHEKCQVASAHAMNGITGEKAESLIMGFDYDVF